MHKCFIDSTARRWRKWFLLHLFCFSCSTLKQSGANRWAILTAGWETSALWSVAQLTDGHLISTITAATVDLGAAETPWMKLTGAANRTIAVMMRRLQQTFAVILLNIWHCINGTAEIKQPFVHVSKAIVYVLINLSAYFNSLSKQYWLRCGVVRMWCSCCHLLCKLSLSAKKAEVPKLNTA